MDIPYRHLKTNRDIDEALECLLSAPLIALDTETTGLDPHTDKLLLLQLGDGQMNYVIDLLAENDLSKQVLDSSVWRKAVEVFTNFSTKIGHNIGFDFKIIKAHFGVELSNIYDTMIAERLLTVGKTVKNKMPALAEIVPKYTNIPAKEMQKEIRAGFYSGYVIKEFSADQILYSARDIAVLIPIYWSQSSQLMQEGLTQTADLEFQVVPITANMEYVGVNFDTTKWVRAIEELDHERLLKRREVEAEFKQQGLEKQTGLFEEYCSISIDSPQQLLKALKLIGIPLEDSVASELLERMTNDYPILDSVLKYKEHQKLITAFGESLLEKINPATGRLHGNFKQMGTDTGRFSASNPNLQQIPSDQKCPLRDCFIPPEGYVALGADYSQQELRVLAAISGEPNMLAAYQKNEDLHTMTTAFLFKRDIDEVKKLISQRKKKMKEERFGEVTSEENEAQHQRGIAKSVNFLIAYGGTYKRLANTARITEDFAREVMDNHGRAFPKLKEFIIAEGDRTLNRLYSETMLGRKRYYVLPDMGNEDYKRIQAAIRRQGVNHVIQGTSGDITKQALLNIHHAFRNRFGHEDAYLWSVVHDEAQAMVKKEIVEEAKEVLEQAMKEAYYKFIPDEICPIQVDAQYGPHWVH